MKRKGRGVRKGGENEIGALKWKSEEREGLNFF